MDCAHFRVTALFDLCMHKESAYTIAEKTDQHSAGHMRRLGCGADARLFDPRA